MLGKSQREPAGKKTALPVSHLQKVVWESAVLTASAVMAQLPHIIQGGFELQIKETAL